MSDACQITSRSIPDLGSSLSPHVRGRKWWEFVPRPENSAARNRAGLAADAAASRLWPTPSLRPSPRVASPSRQAQACSPLTRTGPAFRRVAPPRSRLRGRTGSGPGRGGHKHARARWRTFASGRPRRRTATPLRGDHRPPRRVGPGPHRLQAPRAAPSWRRSVAFAPRAERLGASCPRRAAPPQASTLA